MKRIKIMTDTRLYRKCDYLVGISYVAIINNACITMYSGFGINFCFVLGSFIYAHVCISLLIHTYQYRYFLSFALLMALIWQIILSTCSFSCLILDVCLCATSKTKYNYYATANRTFQNDN